MQGIANLNIIPVRAEQNSRAEMVTQLLFGETYTILEEKSDWLFINTTYDNYSGWINNTQFSEFIGSTNPKKTLTAFPFIQINAANNTIFALPGSEINSQLATNNLNFEPIQLENLTKFASNFLGAPYLWGGKTFFGIDCSGFTQTVFKCAGIKLPRDAYQQAELGSNIDFIEQILPNDLAFFDNAVGKITHVGLMLNNHQIMHASGCVKIDTLDSYGIYNQQLKKHTHKLRVIKRIL